MNKPVLFVGLDALLKAGDDPDPVMTAEISSHAKPFLAYASQHYDVRVLTERNPRDVFYLIRKLNLPNDTVSVRPVFDSKVPAVQGNPNFLWIDAILIPSEVGWLAQHGYTDRYMSVDPEKGIGPEHKAWLDSKVR